MTCQNYIKPRAEASLCAFSLHTPTKSILEYLFSRDLFLVITLCSSTEYFFKDIRCSLQDTLASQLNQAKPVGHLKFIFCAHSSPQLFEVWGTRHCSQIMHEHTNLFYIGYNRSIKCCWMTVFARSDCYLTAAIQKIIIYIIPIYYQQSE